MNRPEDANQPEDGRQGGSEKRGVAGGSVLCGMAKRAELPIVAVSLGDPLGVGPEITVRALAAKDMPTEARFIVFGSHSAMHAAAELSGVAPFWAHCGSVPRIWPRGERVVVVDDGELDFEQLLAREPGPTAEGGRASFAWVERAIACAKGGTRGEVRASAIVTAPISKTSWQLAGIRGFPGHTELLAERFKARRHGMLFVGPSLRVMLATIHVPLMRVGKLLTSKVVLEKIELAEAACRAMGVERPRVGVCGLNPHAGEGGLIGKEDDAVIVPAVAAARKKGIDAMGPLAADTIFASAVLGKGGRGKRFDVVAAMYHDQGLIPIKTLDGMKAVNVTAGLPVVRTSPAHGTAFDVAWGGGKVEAVSMVEAVRAAMGMLNAGKA